MVITPDAVTQPYWDACRRRELRLQRCADCRTYVHFPGLACPACGGSRLEWQAVSGKGRVYSFVVAHQTAIAEFKARVPYVIAWIELDEHPTARVLADLVECDPSQIRIGDRLEVVWDDAAVEGFVVPRFRPAARA